MNEQAGDTYILSAIFKAVILWKYKRRASLFFIFLSISYSCVMEESIKGKKLSFLNFVKSNSGNGVYLICVKIVKWGLIRRRRKNESKYECLFVIYF